MKNHVIDICKMISNTFDVSTFFVTPEGDITFENLDNRILNPLYNNDKRKLFTLLNFDSQQIYNFPVVKKTYFYENYLLISILKENSFRGTIIIGPTVPYAIFEQKINGIFNDFQHFANRELVFNYYETIPIIPKDKFIHMGVTCFYLINQTILSYDIVASENDKLNHLTEKIEPTQLVISQTEDLGPLHHDPLVEKQLLTMIKEGQVEELRKFTKMDKEKTGVLSKSSYIRSRKNLTIVAIAIATRAAIDGGLHSEIAFSLSDNYIQRVEDLSSIEDIDRLQIEAIFTFTKKVSEVKNEQYSTTINKCKNYIFSNRYEKITHDDVARAVQLSHSYLSILFKKEISISLNNYIQQVKIEEAKHLISYTNTPLSEISSLLHFTDQSYFTKVFKKLAGMTPGKYKERHHLI